MMARLFDPRHTALYPQAAVTIVIAVGTWLFFSIGRIDIDVEKHRSQNQASLFDLALQFAPVAISVIGLILLMAKRIAGWWICVSVDICTVAGMISLIAWWVRRGSDAGTVMFVLPFIALYGVALSSLVTKRTRDDFKVLEKLPPNQFVPTE